MGADVVTMAEVAARAGVTKQTVSNVVSGKKVRPETLAKVNTAGNVGLNG